MIRLGDIVDMTFGFAFRSAEFSSDPEDVMLLRGDNIAQGRLRWEGVKRFPRDRVGDFDRYRLAVGDVVIAMDRPWIEAGLKWSIVRESDVPSLLVQRVARLRARSVLDQRYLAAIVGSRAFTDYVIGVQTGSAVPHISGGQIADFTFADLPPMREQRAIAAALGALDDKIESNRRAVGTLNDLAAAQFSVWRGATETSRTVTFGSFADVHGGATPKTSESSYWDGGLAWTTPTDVTRLPSPYLFTTSRTISDHGLRSCAAVMHPVGTILMTSRATIGVFAVNQVPTATNQGFIAVRPRRDAHRWFLLEEMRSRVPEFLDNANGSTFLEISRGRFKELALEVPADAAIDALDRMLAPLHKKAVQLAQEAAALGDLRDSLLPAVLSGRLRFAEEVDS